MRLVRGIFVLLCVPMIAVAADTATDDTSDIIISPIGGTPKNMIYTVPPGSRAQGALKIGNTTTSDQTITLSVEADGGGELLVPFDSLRFYGSIPEDYAEQFESNGQHVERICKKRDESAELDTWCDGVKELSLDVPREDGVTAYYTVAFSDEHNAKATLVAAPSDDPTERTTQVISYVPQIKKVYRGEIRQLKLTRAFDLWDIGAWISAGGREAYDAEVELVNLSTQDLDYTVEMFVRQKDAETPHTKTGTLAKGETISDRFDTVTMPRFGAVSVYARMRYDTPEGEQVAQTEEASIVITPMREIIGGILGLIIFGIGIAAIRRRRRSDDIDPYPHPENDAEPADAFHGADPAAEIGTRAQQSHAAHVTHDKIEVATPEAHDISVEHVDDSADVAAASTTTDIADTAAVAARTGESGAGRASVDTGQDGRGLDIDWIKEDDAVFADAMRMQERRANMRVGAFALLFLGICALIGFFLFSRDFLFVPETKELSIEEVDTIEELPEVDGEIVDERDPASQDDAADDKSDDAGEDSANDADDVDPSSPEATGDAGQSDDDTSEDADTDTDETESATQEDTDEESGADADVAAGDVTVRVLNGSGKAGAAGALTTTLKKAGYVTSAPTNAINSYTTTTIYHTSEASGKAQAQAVKKAIAQTQSTAVIEQSDSIVGRHGVDILVVIGG